MDKKDIGDDDIVVVMTIRCIDMAAVAEVDKIPCSYCGEMTWISASFRGKKIDKIVCKHCFNENYKNVEDYYAGTTQECIDEAFNWAMRSGYNVTKEEIIKSMEKKIGKSVQIKKL